MTGFIRSFCCLLMLAVVALPQDAEAKRFGGGGSFGKSFFTQKKVAPTPVAPRQSTTQQTATQQGMAAPKTAGATRGGMLGGLLAGGLLGALFFGGAFDGIQLMDVLIVGLIGFVLFKLLARSQVARPQPSYAGHPSGHQQAAPKAAAPTAFEPTPLMSERFDEAEVALPEWFDKSAFIDGARQHFAELQKAWALNDLSTIQTYCSSELYTQLVAERHKLGSATLDNDLVSVMVEIIGFAQEGDEARLSINFYGWMREGAGQETTEFNEIWHLTRDLSAADADWFIVGLQQP